tara:strand:+ start:42943 stop:44658 length:1716 start_codon:yes stop_codon:yes gene_type:complete
MRLSNNAIGDTINVPIATNFSFNVSTENQINLIQLYLNDNLFQEIRDIPEQRFYFNPTEYPNGIHKLEIVAIVKSESGSLSDNLNSENFLFVGTWYLSVDNTPPDAIEINDIIESEDGLTISWEPYHKANFLNYQINLHRQESPNEIYNPFLIKDKDQTSITFTDYIGQRLQISVSVNTNYGVAYSSKKLVNSYAIDPLTLDNNDEGFTVSWNKNKFPNNFGSYTLNTSSYPNSNYSLQLFTSPQIIDTSFTYENSIFTEKLSLQLVIRPKSYDYFQQDIVRTIDYNGADKSFDIPKNGSLSSFNGNAILFDFEEIYLYQGLSNQMINSVRHSNGSKSQDFILSSSDLNSDSGIIYKLNAESLGYIESYNVEVLTGVRNRVLRLKASSNSNRAILTSDKCYLFDYETQVVLATTGLPPFSEKIDISANGNLILIDNVIYSYEDGELVVIRDSNTNVQTFFSNTGDIYYEVDQSNNLYIDTFEYKNRTPINKTVIRGFRAPKIYFSKEENFFLASGYYGDDTSDDLSYDLLIVSPSQGMLKNIQVSNPNASYYFLDNTLFSSDDIKLGVDLN